MKKTILLLGASFLIFGAIINSCNTPAEKVESAQTNVAKANEDLNKANQEYLADIENYKKEQAAKIEANNKSITEFNARIENKKMDAKSDYKKKITELEQQNSDMKKKLDDYKADGKDKWEEFKAGFSREMDKLGKAFNDLTHKNVK